MPRASFKRILILILLLALDASHQQEYEDYVDNSIDLERTYVSPIEKVLKGLAIPLNLLDTTATGVQNGVNGILSKLPGPLKGLQSATARSQQGFGDVLNLFKDKFRAVYPGTLWCGAGDAAENENDLGYFRRTDACCRDHDSCQGGIPAAERRDALWNNGIFTRSPCSCDQAFYQCLKNASTIISAKIGVTYFNILRPQCFQQDYPITRCIKYGRSRIANNKCLDYDYNYNQQPREQWFDNPDF